MRVFLFSVLLIAISSCARVIAPTGGVKDTKPPVCIKRYPENRKTNIQKKSFTLVFDEFIKQTNFKESVFVSPVIDDLNFTYRGKKLIVSWEENLRENTTYTFQFVNCIKDYHEGNTLQQLTHSFSTGNTLDSNFISGRILNSFYPKKNKNTVIHLVNNLNFTDSTIKNSYKDYLGFSDEQGNFKIPFLPKDSFYVYVFNDENKNKKLDINEYQGFSEFNINSTLQDSLSNIIPLFKPYLKGNVYSVTSVDSSVYSVNKKDFKIKENNLQFYSEKDTFFTYTFKDSIFITIPKAKNINKIVSNKLDTFNLLKDTLHFLPSYSLLTENGPKGQDIVIELKHLIKNIDTILVKKELKEDSIFVKPTWLNNKIYIKTKNRFFSENERYLITIPDSNVQLISTNFYPKKQFNYSIKSSVEYASLLVEIKNVKSSKIYQLFDAENNIIKQKITKENKIAFKNILPNKEYYFRVVLDENENGLFDTGNIYKGINPEEIIIYKSLLKFKPNWELEIVL